MRQVLEKKYNMTPESDKKWWEVINNIEEYVSREEVERATDIARTRLVKMTEGKKAAYSWSGGKDSLVIAELCQSVGIYKCQCFFTKLEYPAWKKFLLEKAPAGCEFVELDFGLEYLKENPKMLFPKYPYNREWAIQVQRKQFLRNLLGNDIDVLITGHRFIDSNENSGKNGVRRKKDGKILLAPIYDWTHEMLFGFLHYHNIELPFIYRWYRGFFYGTHVWAERRSYDEVYKIDPQVIIDAAEILPSAKEFLKCKLSPKKQAN